MNMKKNYYKSIFIVVIFSITILFISLLGSLFNATNNIIKEKKILYGNGAKNLSISYTGKIDNKNFLNVLDSCPGVIIGNTDVHIISDNGTMFGSAIYFNKNIDYKVPIIQGSFLKTEDCILRSPVAVIGKGLLNNVKVEGKNKYLVFDGIKYKVIGVMGYQNKSSYYDSRFVVNLSCLLKNDKELNRNKYFISSIKNNSEEFAVKLKNELNRYYVGLNISLNNSNVSVNPIKEILDHNNSFVIMVIIVLVASILNLINVTTYWISDKRKEIGLRKAVGGSDFDIALKIIKEYQKLGIISSVIALLAHYLLQLQLKKHISENFYIYPFNLIVVIIFALIIGTIISIIPIVRSRKILPSEIMRGR